MSNTRPHSVHVLYEHSSDGIPYGCSQIRLLRPLSHPSLSQQISLTYGVELPSVLPDTVIIERFWNQRCDTDSLEVMMQCLQSQGVTVLAELDDDLLTLGDDPDYSSTLTINKKMWLRRLLRTVNGVIVSTPLLAERISGLNNIVKVIPNALDERLFRRKQINWSMENSQITFGYMGTYTHIDDLISIIGPLRRIIAKYGKKVSLELVGVGDSQLLHDAFKGIEVTIRHVPPESVDYEKFTAWMQDNLRWDFGIAPLLDTPFSRAKSDIKYLDYGVQGIPGIFSSVAAYSDTVRHLQNGLLAATVTEWEASLELMITDRASRNRIAQTAYADVWEGRMLSARAGLWLETINSITEPAYI